MKLAGWGNAIIVPGPCGKEGCLVWEFIVRLFEILLILSDVKADYNVEP